MPSDDAFLAELRAILLSQDRAHVDQVTDDVVDLKQLLHDDEKLTQVIAPVMDRALRTSIEQNREEMIEALYPIIGQTVVRAVREAVQDLARTVDARFAHRSVPAWSLNACRLVYEVSRPQICLCVAPFHSVWRRFFSFTGHRGCCCDTFRLIRLRRKTATLSAGC